MIVRSRRKTQTYLGMNGKNERHCQRAKQERDD